MLPEEEMWSIILSNYKSADETGVFLAFTLDQCAAVQL